MTRRKHTERVRPIDRRKSTTQAQRKKNKAIFHDVCHWLAPKDGLFANDTFHGNTKWVPEQLVTQALVWSWQKEKNVTDAFDQSLEICEKLGVTRIAKTYPAFMNALDRYRPTFTKRMGERLQSLAQDVGGQFWRSGDWVLIGFDGSRVTVPRTVANEKAFCAPNFGHGVRAKYGKKKSKGMRRKRNEKNKPQPQGPQIWITMMWHMSLRLPWSWRLGPSNSSERGHVVEMLQHETFPEKTLFCGDAGFVGYPLWSAIIVAGGDFLVRVGGNVKLLSKHADIKKLGGGQVLCWPKGKMNSGAAPLKLRLVKVKVGKTLMWMLTSVCSVRKLTNKNIIRYYKMRWGIEVEFRGLKQTIDKHTLRCRNSDRALVELDWSVRAMAVAELLALREQIPQPRAPKSKDAYDPKDRSLANTMRSLRRCMRNLDSFPRPSDHLLTALSRALVQTYHHRTDRRSRYRPKSAHKKPLGDPEVRKMNAAERMQLAKFSQNQAA